MLRSSTGAAASGIIFENLYSYYVLGTRHGFKQSDDVTAEFQRGFSLATECVGVSNRLDLAVRSLLASETAPEIVPLVFGSSAQLQPGQECYVIGSPFAKKGVFTPAKIDQAPKPPNNPETPTPASIRISALVEPGSSGSPLIDDQATVVGMVFAKEALGQGLAIPIEEIRSELPLFIDNLKRLSPRRNR